MKAGFYPRLAAGSIRRNGRVFVPYILTCAGMVMMFYIILFLAVSDTLNPLYGADTLRLMFKLGSRVITVFAAIFLFYTNSFLMRRRKKEFGLYQVLGMGKGNLGRILFWETLMIAAISLTAGLAAGIALSKMAELGLVYIMQGTPDYDLSVSWPSVGQTLQVFGVIFILILLNSVRQVRFASAISLVHSENVGEKPPKGNWLLGLAGAAILAAAYYLAVTIQDPIVALVTFFAAVVMVICGTYLVMIAGSVVFCRLLQKNKRYYYRPNHFVSVASMVYRMKRNGAGLASICILATMVLVMIASSACLYFGEESVISRNYPREINMDIQFGERFDLSDERIRELKEEIDTALREWGARPGNGYSFRSIYFYGILLGDTVVVDADLESANPVAALAKSRQFSIVPLADYNAVTGKNVTLREGEALISLNRREKYAEDTLSFRSGRTFRIVGRAEDFAESEMSAKNASTTVMLIVPDAAAAVEGLETLAAYDGSRLLRAEWIYSTDTGLEPEEQAALYQNLYGRLTDAAVKERLGYASCLLSCREIERNDFYGLFGGLFYIGILLSIVFILAAVLIIYYKQISEGYEDQARFAIMQKIGMTAGEIRRSVNSQLLTVFFLPLVFAAVHLTFAFPIIRKILLAFSLDNVRLFAAVTGITFLAFAVFYTAVYRLTAAAYYHIVSGTGESDG